MKPGVVGSVAASALLVLSTQGVTADGSPLSPAGAGGAALANNEFAFDAYAHLAKEPGNLFFSPYSAENVLALAWAGAGGQTAGQMAKVLHLLDPAGGADAGFAALTTKLNADEQPAAGLVGADGKTGIPFQLFVANSMWCQQSFPFRKAFLTVGQDQYGASLHQVDFQQATEAARLEINDWLAKETHGKIENMIPSGALDPLARLVLANAVYFKAHWHVQFDKSRTHDAPFHIDSKQSLTVPTMNQESEFEYCEAKNLRVLELPYFSGRISMIILLPAKVEGLPGLERSLNARQLSQWLAQTQPRQVNLFLPRFKFANELRLDDTLRAMGMTDAFSLTADFSGIATGPLFISAVLQNAYVDVNEEGTEATAATAGWAAGGIPPKPPPPVILRVDHPFIFLIRHNETGAILFVGRVARP
jgi:serpin B